MNNFRINKSASRALDILDLVSKGNKSFTMTEISQALKLPKSSTFELVYTLVEKGFLDYADKDLKTFKLGLKTFEVGAAFLTKADLHGVARPFLEDLNTKTGETVFLAVEDQGEVVYLDKMEALSSVKTTATLGARNPMHRTGLGKALLATYLTERVKEVTGDGELETRTEFSISHFNQLVKELERTRRRGYAIDNQENETDIYCLAAPIYNGFNKPIAAISIAGIASRIQERQEELSKLLVNTALSISKRLGYLQEKLYCDVS